MHTSFTCLCNSTLNVQKILYTQHTANYKVACVTNRVHGKRFVVLSLDFNQDFIGSHTQNGKRMFQQLKITTLQKKYLAKTINIWVFLNLFKYQYSPPAVSLQYCQVLISKHGFPSSVVIALRRSRCDETVLGNNLLM